MSQFPDPVRRSHLVATEADLWDTELALIVSVRDWVDDIDPGDEATMRAGVGAALHALASGASVAEAAGYARSCVTSRLRHPSHPAMWSGRIPAAS